MIFDLSKSSNVNDWLTKLVPQKTFADLGGLWGTVNERVSVAALAGASEYSMWDIQPKDRKSWELYRNRLSEQGVSGGFEKCLDCMDLEQVEKTEPVDVLHCSGIIYHIPNYYEFLRNIGKLTKEYLILASTVVPDVIENESGVIRLDGGLLPNVGLPPMQQSILKTHWEKEGVSAPIVNTDTKLINLKKDNEIYNYSPWWWFFTPDYLYNLLLQFGYEILNHKCVWQGKAYAYLCRKPTSGQS
jgi:hypothetical protein